MTRHDVTTTVCVVKRQANAKHQQKGDKTITTNTA